MMPSGADLEIEKPITRAHVPQQARRSRFVQRLASALFFIALIYFLLVALIPQGFDYLTAGLAVVSVSIVAGAFFIGRGSFRLTRRRHTDPK